MKIIKNLEEIKLEINTKAIIFDCFGTLMQIKDNQNPYRFIYEEFTKQGVAHENFFKFIMSNDLSFKDIEKEMGVELPKEVMLEFFKKLNKEIVSIENFKETTYVLSSLKKSGLKIAMCSNLASPYGYPALKNVSELDNYFLSYKIGLLKPDMDMFKYCQDSLGLEKKEILFVGDSRNSDYNGALAYGFNAMLLIRN